MANNPYVNKVKYGNDTVMDISDTTAEESDVAEGEVFYKGNGQRSVGTGNYYSPNDDPEIDIADGDYFPFYDISANSGSGAKRKSLWSNIKAKLKTYFDNLYATITDRDNLIIEMAYADYQQLTQQQQEDPNKIYWCPDAPNSDDVVFPREEQRVLGAKNLFTYPYYATTKTENGVTFTDNGDGTITVNGTATADTTFVLSSSYDSFKFSEGVYIISGCPGGGSSLTYLIRYTLRNISAGVTTWFEEIGEGSQFIQTPNIKCHYSEIKIFAGTVCDNLVFKPMIRLASDPDNTYVPYAMTNKEITNKICDYNEFIWEEISANSQTLAAGSWVNITKDISKTGYKPLFVTALTTYNTDVVLIGSGFNDATTAIASVRNIANASKQVTVKFQVLYKKL